MAASEIGKLKEDTQLIEVAESRVKYINKKFVKVTAKMYDAHCDIKLKVGNETFRAHKDVLSDASLYFSAMFSHNMLEKEQESVELHEISPKGFSAMMEYFYHGHLTIELTNIADILEAARFFHIEWLIKVCCHFLIRHLSLENYNFALELADKYYLGDLRDDIFQFVSLNFVRLSKEAKFMHISFEILYILLSENLYIDASESYILHTVLRWLNFNPEDREEARVQLLDLIKFPLVEIDDLENIPKEIRKMPELSQTIEDAIDYKVKPYAQCLLATDKTEARGSVEALVLIDAINDAENFTYKVPGSDHLKEPVDTSFMQSVFEFASVAVLGNFLFVAGGYDRFSWCSSPAFYHYDPRARLWAQLKSMMRPRVSFPLTASDSLLYAVAGIEHMVQDGRDVENIHKTVEVYNPQVNDWEFLPEIPFGCFNCSAAVHKQNLYISGGISSDPEDNVPTNYLHAFMVGNRTWVPLTPMLTGRQNHAMVNHDDKLFVLGGFTDGQDTMSFDDCFINEVYDIELDQWSIIKEIPVEYGHWHSAVTSFADSIYILGGKQAEQHRFLHKFNTKDEEISEGEYCGECTQKLVVMKVPLPQFLLTHEPSD